MCLANIIMVFHRILDFKMGWISILALFYFCKCLGFIQPHKNYQYEESYRPIGFIG